MNQLFERARESKSKIDAKTNQDIKKTIEKDGRVEYDAANSMKRK